MNKKNNKQNIKNNIYGHMFVVFVVLLYLNACLMRSGIIWADIYDSTLIILFFTLALGTLEMIFNDVYVYDLKIQILIGILGLIGMILTIIDIINGEKIFLNESLTRTGGGLITMILLLFIQLELIIKILFDKFKKMPHENVDINN